MNQNYASLVSPGLQTVEEISSPYHCLTERHIQAMWFEQKYFKNLTTLHGEPIVVISPGIWNAEAGPDFQKAHFKIGPKDYYGDIEIHLNDSSWQQHQHHLDERYNSVVLHVSLWNPKQQRAIKTQQNNEVIQAYLEDFLTLPLARIVQLIDLDLYPYKKFIGSGRCAHELFRSLSENNTRAFFHDASDWRLSQKRKYLESRISNPEWQLGGGIAMALGYKNNAQSFLELFIWLHEQKLKNNQEILALGMRACGFFDEKYQKRWGHSDLYCQLHTTAKALHASSSYQCKLTLNQIRPFNHPIRRLVVMSKILSDPTFPLLHDQMLRHWSLNWAQACDKRSLILLRDQFFALLPTYEDSYWNRHYTFDTQSTETILPLMGIDLKTEIIVNTCLPLLHKRIFDHADAKELEAFYNLYATIPASKTGKTRYLVHRFFGDTPKGAILNKAIMEQGAYQLHKDFCIHFEASCEGCPFVERFKMGVKEKIY